MLIYTLALFVGCFDVLVGFSGVWFVVLVLLVVAITLVFGLTFMCLVLGFWRLWVAFFSLVGWLTDCVVLCVDLVATIGVLVCCYVLV